MRPELRKLLADYLGGHHVLVIEPAMNYRTSIKQFFSNLRVKNLKTANSVAEAQRELLTITTKLILVEWQLEDRNGLQYCRDLRKDPRFENTPIILMSTENLRHDVVLASEVGINGYLLKPFSFEVFCDQIEFIISNINQPCKMTSLFAEADQALSDGKVEEAEELYFRAATLFPNSAKAASGIARIEFMRGNEIGAITYLKSAIDNNPDFLEAYRELVSIYKSMGDKKGLLRAAKDIHSKSPDNPKYSLILAHAFLEMNEIEQSEKHFRKTIRLSPMLAEGYKGLGNMYMKAEDYEKAMKNFNKALDLEKDDIGVINSLGLSYVRRGMLPEGIAQYLLALKLDSRNTKVLFNLGQAYEKQNNLSRALTQYNRALTFDPEFEKAKRGVQRIQAKTGSNGQTDQDYSDLDDDLDETG